jgi:SpoVK/Ycf46/Vps4 family AAA+-type ATPase
MMGESFDSPYHYIDTSKIVMKTKTKELIEDIIHRYKAGYPVIWVKTEEYARAIEMLQNRFREENQTCEKIIEEKFSGVSEEEIPANIKPKKVFHWDAINGLVEVTNPHDAGQRVFPFPPAQKGQLVAEPPAHTHILSWAGHLSKETVPEGSVVLVNGFHNLLAAAPPTEHGRIRQALLQIIQPSVRKVEGQIKYGLREGISYRTVIFVGPKPDHPALSPDVMTYMEVLELPRPSEDELIEMIELQLGDRETTEGKPVTDDKKLVLTCAHELKGTTVFQSENAIALTYIKRRALDQATLRRQYKAIMELHPALTLADYKESWEDIVGFELYKKFITALFHPDQKHPLKGVLFVGAPGTGKSHTAKATGAHLGLKTIFCNLGRVFNKYIGDSEANTESLFRSIDACGQAIVYIDEIEKGLGGMGKGHGGDGGVSDRVMQQTLTWMNDHDSGAFIIATANDPHILPPELLREGRWDCIFNVPPPNKAQRMALANLYANKSELKIDAVAIAEKTQDWVGAEIKGLMQKAQIFKIASKSDEDAIETAFSYVKPMCISDKDRFFKRIEDSKAQGVSVNIEEDSIADFEIPSPEEITKTQVIPKSRKRTLEG